jgi:hypothetical protein
MKSAAVLKEDSMVGMNQVKGASLRKKPSPVRRLCLIEIASQLVP